MPFLIVFRCATNHDRNQSDEGGTQPGNRRDAQQVDGAGETRIRS